MSSGASRSKRLRWLLAGGLAAAVGVCALYAGNYRFIRAKEALYRVPKEAFGYTQTYVDVREWGPRDFAANPKIASQLVRAQGKQALHDLGGALQDLGDALEKK
ncbi:MAG: hypothetical protein KDD82_30830 [Planctomycetes bacterium]|nr:hypothetical protein [Planctomycetota bacterium]